MKFGKFEFSGKIEDDDDTLDQLNQWNAAVIL